MRNVYIVWVGKPERKEQHRRPRHRWMILNWVLRNTISDGLDSSGSGLVVGCCKHGNIISGS
jgi:hypothetical protein